MPLILQKSTLALAAALILAAGMAAAQTTSVNSAAERKVTLRVPPLYPELAKKMHIRGVVKIEAVVKPNGLVKSARVLGGNPVLLEAAKDAVTKWKFEPAQSETTEVVQLAFEDQRQDQ